MSNEVSRVDNPFGNGQMQVQGGGASAMAAAQREVAEVQAAMVIAKKFPRDQKRSLDMIINACCRPGLAEVAMYQYSRGGTDISGPSIRLAEELARNWGNMAAGVTELSRGNGVSECMAYCHDLETNYRDEKRFQIKHWRDTRGGGYAITDERDIYELIANNGSRRKRACILSVIPGDVQELAVRQCEVTLRSNVDVTDELLKTVLDKFTEYGVTKGMIEDRIQRRFTSESVAPGHILSLRKIFNSLKDGMSSAEDWFPTVPSAADDGKKSAASKMDNLAGKAAAEKEPEPEPQKKTTRKPRTSKKKEPEPEQQAAPEAPAKAQQQEPAREGQGSAKPRFVRQGNEVIDTQLGVIVPSEHVRLFHDDEFSVLNSYGHTSSTAGETKAAPAPQQDDGLSDDEFDGLFRSDS